MSKAVTERFVKSFLDLFVLDLLDNSPKHGYEIMRELKNRTGTRIGAGTLYPLLYELEERKLVVGEWNSPNRRSRKIYKITDQGTRFKRQGFGNISVFVRPSGSAHTGA
jgi:PadR family transcriptional regulator, regulatory protein PadR